MNFPNIKTKTTRVYDVHLLNVLCKFNLRSIFIQGVKTFEIKTVPDQFQ